MDTTANPAFAYFATPEFHERMLGIDETLSADGWMPPEEMAKRLGCRHEDFFAYVQTLMDDDGVAYVPVGHGTVIAIDMSTPEDEAAGIDSARDFRARHPLQLCEAPALETVPQDGEIRFGSHSESEESYAVASYAKTFGVPRQVLVNDDLSTFTDLSRRHGVAAAVMEAGRITGSSNALSPLAFGEVMTLPRAMHFRTNRPTDPKIEAYLDHWEQLALAQRAARQSSN